MADVRVPAYKVTYEGQDITEDISKDVVRINYTDAEGGEADEIRITVDDMFAKWKDSWRPNRGDKITLSIGYAGEGLMDMGSFSIDEVHYRGQPDVVEFRALSVPIDSGLWELKSRAFDGNTVREVAEQIARENNLELIYNVFSPSSLVAATDERTNKILELRHQRFYQDRETDLAFLNRIANRYGIKFSVKGNVLSYVLVYDLHTIPPVETLEEFDLTEANNEYREFIEQVNRPRPQIRSYDLRDCQSRDASGVDVISFNQFAFDALTYGIDNDFLFGQKLFETVPTIAQTMSIMLAGDLSYLRDKRNLNEYNRLRRRIKVYEEVDNISQAELIAMAKMFEAITSAVEGAVELEGTPIVQAGTNIQVRGLRWLDGKYHVTSTTHDINRGGGYTTRADVKMVGLLSD